MAFLRCESSEDHIAPCIYRVRFIACVLTVIDVTRSNGSPLQNLLCGEPFSHHHLPPENKPSMSLPRLPRFICITYLGSSQHGFLLALEKRRHKERICLGHGRRGRPWQSQDGTSLGLAVLVLTSLDVIGLMAIALVLAHWPANHACQSQSGRQGPRSARSPEGASRGENGADSALSPSSQDVSCSLIV